MIMIFFSRKVVSAPDWRWVGRQREAEATGQTKGEEALNLGSSHR